MHVICIDPPGPVPIPLRLREASGFNPVRPWSRRSAEGGGEEPLFAVRIIDNDHNTYQQVMDVSMRALGLSIEQAYLVAWTVDHEGSCVVCVAPRPLADQIGDIIRTIGIEVRVEAYAPEGAQPN